MKRLTLYRCKRNFLTDKGRVIKKGEYYILRGRELFDTRWNERYSQIDCRFSQGRILTDDKQWLEKPDDIEDYLEKHEQDY